MRESNSARLTAGRWTLVVLVIACLTRSVAAQSAPAPALISGRVVDGASLAGLPGVEVLLLGGASLATTNESGDFRATVTVRGSVTLVLRKIGYEAVGVPLAVDVGDSLHVATKLTRLAQDLDTLRVRGRAEELAPPRHAGFERRRLNSKGTFITPEQLERTGSVSIGDVLRGVSGIKVTSDMLGTLAIESMRGDRLDRSAVRVPCRVRVLVDGFLMPFGVPLPVTSPKQLHGIEVYSGPATMPVELVPHGEDAFCGLVAIWTK
ncbi:MAG TPA: carboxypeptidase regulatory-like domain-containing protein [Gemmatimonadaceae bacterium]|nr:carboxypeptidase regulatory-like domain-containing protein [Gemmatimonadaceae bacterium]